MKTDSRRIRIPRKAVHFHNYGKISPYFVGLEKNNLVAIFCVNPRCSNRRIELPPRADCRYCWESMKWMDLGVKPKGKIETFSVVNYPGAGFEEDLTKVGGKLPCIIIYVEFPGILTKLMSILENCTPNDVWIGMRVEARFRKKAKSRIKSGYTNSTCLDLYFVPVGK